MGKLDGRVALVTGSTQGIGHAVATRLAAEGATVVVHGPDEAGVDRALGDIPGSVGVVGDVGDSAAVAAFCAEAKAAAGRLEIVVNNAGTSVSGPFLDQTDADWDLLLSVNLLGTRDVMRAVIPDMVEAGHGRIVNVTSEAGLHGTPTFAAYAASKGAIASLTLTMAQELAGSGVLVNGFAPLGITDLLRANVPEEILDSLRDSGMPTLERNAEELLPLVLDDAPTGQIRAMQFDGTPTAVHGGLADS
jgi:NAD(P)-dependent dehydrogenase (short-subunit alcohol dehydrogenase family)